MWCCRKSGRNNPTGGTVLAQVLDDQRYDADRKISGDAAANLKKSH